MELKFVCNLCNEDQEPFLVGMDDLTAHSNGALAQEVFEYLRPDQRELLISRTCDRCWQSMFPDCNEDSYEDDDSL